MGFVVGGLLQRIKHEGATQLVKNLIAAFDVPLL